MARILGKTPEEAGAVELAVGNMAVVGMVAASTGHGHHDHHDRDCDHGIHDHDGRDDDRGGRRDVVRVP